MAIKPLDDPIALFRLWYADAHKTDLKLPSAVAMATADASGVPNVRMVLLKDVDERGFTIYTNLASRKARELVANPTAALCFHWMPLARQVRVQGRVEQVTDAEADAYFASRDRQSRIGAWASKQSEPLTSTLELERRVAKYAAKFGVGDVPRPSFWSGYRIVPEIIEFWEERPFRLHERLEYCRTDDGWARQWLFP